MSAALHTFTHMWRDKGVTND